MRCQHVADPEKGATDLVDTLEIGRIGGFQESLLQFFDIFGEALDERMAGVDDHVEQGIEQVVRAGAPNQVFAMTQALDHRREDLTRALAEAHQPI